MLAHFRSSADLTIIKRLEALEQKLVEEDSEAAIEAPGERLPAELTFEMPFDLAPIPSGSTSLAPVEPSLQSGQTFSLAEPQPFLEHISTLEPTGLNNVPASGLLAARAISNSDDHVYGTLMLGQGGRSKYLGPTAGSDWLRDVSTTSCFSLKL